MAAETTIAREGRANPINAIRGNATSTATIKSRIKEFGGEFNGVQRKDGITGFAASFDYYDAKDFANKYGYRATTNVGDTYEFVTAEDYEKWRTKRGR